MDSTPYKVHRIGLVKVSIYLLYRSGEAILVDCGPAGSELKIMETLKKLDLRADMLKLLLLTHAHYDHAGAAGRLRELTGCKIAIHRLEAERLTEGFTSIPAGTRWKAKLLVGVGRTFARGLMKYQGCVPDLQLEDSYDLKEYGFPGKVIHTPGHTIGSMVVLMEGGELISGDTFFGVEGKQHFPPFAEDLPALLRSWKMLRSVEATKIFPAHGRYFAFGKFLDEYQDSVKKYTRGD
jgi:hydroxyacylglutathione hydrolase